MKAAIMQGFGSQSQFQLKDVEKPRCGKKDVLVEVYNAAINPLDWKLHKAFSFVPFDAAAPLILGRDIAGVVVEKGSQVHDFNIGDEVYGLSQNFIKGTFAEYAAVKANQLARKPSSISFAEAAAVPLVGMTAAAAFKNETLIPGARVLIIGASGGVGSMAVQIAKARGAYVIGVCSGKNKALVLSLGADEVIDYTCERYSDLAQPVDLVFDTVGNANLASCSRIMNKDARFYTTMPGPKTAVDFVESTLRAKFQKVNIVSAFSNRKALDNLTRLIESKQLKPLLDSEFSFADINAAMERSKTNRAVGKIILTMKQSVEQKSSHSNRAGAEKNATHGVSA